MQRAQTEDGSLHDLFEKSYKDFLDLNLTLAQQDGGSLHALFEESNTHFHHVLRQAKLKFRDKLIKLAKKIRHRECGVHGLHWRWYQPD